MSARAVISAMTATVGGLALVFVANPAMAAGESVEIVAHTSFVEPVSQFESTLAGCEDGTVVGGRTAVPPTRGIGVFSGIKEFTCSGGEGGFAIQLNARFPVDPGSVEKFLRDVLEAGEEVEGPEAQAAPDLGQDDQEQRVRPVAEEVHA